MRKNILDYTEEELKESVRLGVSPPQALRDREICERTKRGQSVSTIAFEMGIGERTVIRSRRLIR